MLERNGASPTAGGCALSPSHALADYESVRCLERHVEASVREGCGEVVGVASPLDDLVVAVAAEAPSLDLRFGPVKGAFHDDYRTSRAESLMQLAEQRVQ